MITQDSAFENNNVPTSISKITLRAPLELSMHHLVDLDRNLYCPSLEPRNVSDLRYESHMRTSAIVKRATLWCWCREIIIRSVF